MILACSVHSPIFDTALLTAPFPKLLMLCVDARVHRPYCHTTPCSTTACGGANEGRMTKQCTVCADRDLTHAWLRTIHWITDLLRQCGTRAVTQRSASIEGRNHIISTIIHRFYMMSEHAMHMSTMILPSAVYGTEQCMVHGTTPLTGAWCVTAPVAVHAIQWQHALINPVEAPQCSGHGIGLLLS